MLRAGPVGLGGDGLHHLLEAGISVDKGKTAEHVHHVQDVVPDEGVLELAKVGADAKHVDLTLGLVFPVPKEHLGTGARGGTVQQFRHLS